MLIHPFAIGCGKSAECVELQAQVLLLGEIAAQLFGRGFSSDHSPTAALDVEKLLEEQERSLK